MFNKKLAALAVAAVGSLAAAQVQALPVGLELALLMDVSGSVDGTEYALQRDGYANAFRNATVQAAIAGTPGGIAVTLVQWSGTTQQTQSIGWTLLTDAASATAFGNAIWDPNTNTGITRAFSGNTAPGSAINFAAPLFTNNFEGNRLTIDVSGDGSQNEGANTAAARNAALAGGVNTINGLPILGSEAGLDVWYANNIQGGPGSFTLPANSFAAFEAAVAEKLRREITVPEPVSLALMGTALVGLFGVRRRQSV